MRGGKGELKVLTVFGTRPEAIREDRETWITSGKPGVDTRNCLTYNGRSRTDCGSSGINKGKGLIENRVRMKEGNDADSSGIDP